MNEMASAHIEPTVARRIDRLARRAHAFHRFAHHPLCDRYSGELIALGTRRRVCRGCTCALAGAVAGAALGAVLEFPLPAALAFAVLATSVPVIAQRFESDPNGNAARRQARLGKLWTRGVPLAALALAFTAGLRAQNTVGVVIALSIALVLFVLLRAYRRAGPDRSPCARCPERTWTVPCSGFRDIVRAERAFVRRSRQLMTYPPNRLRRSAFLLR
jgi:hypothetical protein